MVNADLKAKCGQLNLANATNNKKNIKGN